MGKALFIKLLLSLLVVFILAGTVLDRLRKIDSRDDEVLSGQSASDRGSMKSPPYQHALEKARSVESMLKQNVDEHFQQSEPEPE